MNFSDDKGIGIEGWLSGRRLGSQRRLGAIMFTDMVGHTALTQRNEALELELLEEHRKLLRPLFAKHFGTEIKTIGDAFLVEFMSALEATNCAYKIQRALHDRNSARALETKILLRIGIHLGDIIHDSSGDVHGDAVNIASRIQPLALPGGICITQQVYDQIRNKVEFSVVSLGKRALKNVDLPMEVFAVSLPWEAGLVDKRGGQVTSSLIPAGSAAISTGIQSLDEILGGRGYPDRSSILVNGPPGIGKEALGYWFVHSGLVHGDYCLYVTHRLVSDVMKNMRAYGVPTDRAPEWIASAGSEKRCDLSDPTSISSNIEQAVLQNKDRHVRIVTDVLSPLLVMNPSESMYRYWSQLITELKQNDVVFLALADEGMHPPNVMASMEQLFDSVIELRIFEQGLLLTPLLRVKKMLMLPPFHDYFKFHLSRNSMEITANVSY